MAAAFSSLQCSYFASNIDIRMGDAQFIQAYAAHLKSNDKVSAYRSLYGQDDASKCHQRNGQAYIAHSQPICSLSTTRSLFRLSPRFICLLGWISSRLEPSSSSPLMMKTGILLGLVSKHIEQAKRLDVVNDSWDYWVGCLMLLWGWAISSKWS